MVQRTFTIVPAAGPAERTPVDNRPMTSKQVRKAYKEANRVPRMSKTERIRQERAEQERIRKEFEKEKAAFKAKTLREKKRAKEQAEREEKKKKGLPLVNVRPSQDTIARFVRGNGSGIKRDSKGQNAASTPVLPIAEEPEEDDSGMPSPKRFCNQEQQREEVCDEREDETVEKVFPPEKPCTKSDAAPEKIEHRLEDDFLDGFEIMSDDDDNFPSPKGLYDKEGQRVEVCEGPGEEAADNDSALEEQRTRSDDAPEKNEPAAEDDFLAGFGTISDDDFSITEQFSNQVKLAKKGRDKVEDDEESVAMPENPCAKSDTTPEKNERSTEDDFMDGFEIMSDDEISKLSFNQAALRDYVGSAKDYFSSGPDPASEEGGKGQSFHEPALQKPDSPISIKNPQPAPQEFDLIFDDEDDLEQEMLALGDVLTSQQKTSKELTQEAVPRAFQKPVRAATDYEVDLGLATSFPHETSRRMSPTKHEQACLMPPPPKPKPMPAAPQRSRSPTSPVAMKPQAPPLSTQQILFNMDDFFPTSSQQEAELEEESMFISQPMKPSSAAGRRSPSPAPEKHCLPSDTSSSPEPPKPFFTSSGSNERLAVALLRSRRTAEREEEQRRRAIQLEALELEEAKKKEAERRAREKRMVDSKLKSTTTTYAALSTESSTKGQAPRQTGPISTTPQFSPRNRLATNAYRPLTKPAMQRAPLTETRANGPLPTMKPHPTPKVRPVQHGKPPRQQSVSTAAKITNTTLPRNAESIISKAPTTYVTEITTSPRATETKHLMASQESEFGGSWMDELATELSV